MTTMIKVNYGNNVNRSYDMVENTTTLRAFLESHGVDYSRGATHLDGSALQRGDIDKTFEELGYGGETGSSVCFLLQVTKADNA